MKSTIPWLIAASAGVVMILAYFIPYAQSWQEEVGDWFEILAAFAFVLGGANLFGQHLRKISARRAGWGYSAVTLIAFLAAFLTGCLKIGVPAAPGFTDYAWSGSYRAEGSPFWWLFWYVYNPLTATMFALLAFYVASAAFRAFRAKTSEATLLLGAALVVLLGRTYAGVWLTSSVPEKLPALTLPGMVDNVVMPVFNTAGQRSMMIGIALGVAATALKVLMGVDRSYLGAEGD